MWVWVVREDDESVGEVQSGGRGFLGEEGVEDQLLKGRGTREKE